MKIGLAADHSGYALKENIKPFLTSMGYLVIDFGAHYFNELDDYSDTVIPMARAIHNKKIKRGIAICGSAIGSSIAANKIQGVRAALVSDHFAAHQGVENDNMNLLCLGGTLLSYATAKELIKLFLEATFTNEKKHVRRLQKILSLEHMISVADHNVGTKRNRSSLNRK